IPATDRISPSQPGKRRGRRSARRHGECPALRTDRTLRPARRRPGAARGLLLPAGAVLRLRACVLLPARVPAAGARALLRPPAPCAAVRAVRAPLVPSAFAPLLPGPAAAPRAPRRRALRLPP